MDAPPRRPAIFVVDDEPADVMILVQTLKRDYDVATAANGPEALERLGCGGCSGRKRRAALPDLILLDVQMPAMDGFAVCRRILANPELKDIPILFLTSLDDVVCKTHGFEAGAVDYITKPFHLPEVLARVRTHLNLKRAREELRRNEQQFRRLAETDDLTGLYNTRYLFQALAGAVDRCAKENQPLASIFMDLDYFKRVVDTHGHLYGSLAIQEVAATIQSCLSPPAFAVSYAGDEFVIVLPGADKDTVLRKVVEIRDRMAATAYLAKQGLALALGASFGVAVFPEDGPDPRILLAAADRALFEDKKRRKENSPTGKDARRG